MEKYLPFIFFALLVLLVIGALLYKDYRACKKSLDWPELPTIALVDETRFIDDIKLNKMLLMEGPGILEFGIWYTIPKGFIPTKGTTVAFKYFEGQLYIIPVKNHHKGSDNTVSFDRIKKANSPGAVQLTVLNL